MSNQLPHTKVMTIALISGVHNINVLLMISKYFQHGSLCHDIYGDKILIR